MIFHCKFQSKCLSKIHFKNQLLHYTGRNIRSKCLLLFETKNILFDLAHKPELFDWKLECLRIWIDTKLKSPFFQHKKFHNMFWHVKISFGIIHQINNDSPPLSCIKGHLLMTSHNFGKFFDTPSPNFHTFSIESNVQSSKNYWIPTTTN